MGVLSDTFEATAETFARSHKVSSKVKKAQQYAEHAIGTDITRNKVFKIIKKLKLDPDFKKLSKLEKKKAIKAAIGKSMVIKQTSAGLAIKGATLYGGYKLLTSGNDKENE